MKSILFILLAALVYTAPVLGESSDSGINLSGENSGFLVKLTTSMSAETSKPGDTIKGMIIDPRPLRGGQVEGTIERADRSFLNFSFHTVTFEGKSYPIESKITGIVSSRGNAGQDDLGQRIRIAGDVIAYGTTTAINEGAEIYFVAWDKPDDVAE